MRYLKNSSYRDCFVITGFGIFILLELLNHAKGAHSTYKIAERSSISNEKLENYRGDERDSNSASRSKLNPIRVKSTNYYFPRNFHNHQEIVNVDATQNWNAFRRTGKHSPAHADKKMHHISNNSSSQKHLDYINNKQLFFSSLNSKDVIPNRISQNIFEIQCPPCDKVHCSPRRARHLRCHGGLTSGVCGCCPVCAKQADEPCGGHWNYLGKCDQGLVCEPLNKFSENSNVKYFHKVKLVEDGSIKDVRHQLRQPESNFLSNKSMVSVSNETIRIKQDYKIKNKSPKRSITEPSPKWFPEGKCVPGYEMNDSPSTVVKCRPKCSLEFCRENPKEICSAVYVVEEKKSCSGVCQHTSCSACKLIRKTPPCHSCPAEDFSCIRKFGKCLRQEFCSKVDFPCRQTSLFHSAQSYYKLKTNNFHFRCITPSCLT